MWVVPTHFIDVCFVSQPPLLWWRVYNAVLHKRQRQTACSGHIMVSLVFISTGHCSLSSDALYVLYVLAAWGDIGLLLWWGSLMFKKRNDCISFASCSVSLLYFHAFYFQLVLIGFWVQFLLNHCRDWWLSLSYTFSSGLTLETYWSVSMQKTRQISYFLCTWW